jgi:hypothetical protein
MNTYKPKCSFFRNRYYDYSFYNTQEVQNSKVLKVERTEEFSYTHNDSRQFLQPLLLIKFKLIDSEKSIEITRYDNIFTKAFQFCYENNLGYHCVTPITHRIILALSELNRVMDSEVDNDAIDRVKEAYVKRLYG